MNTRKLKMLIRRTHFKFKVRRIMKSRKVKSLNTFISTHRDRGIGKTTYLVDLIKKHPEENGVLVVATPRQKEHLENRFPGVEVQTVQYLMENRQNYKYKHLVLYIDEPVFQEDVENLMPYYSIRIYIRYMHVARV